MKTEINTQNTTHNGWTNYATWRINLEIFDGYNNEDCEPVTVEELREHAENLIEHESNGGLALDYALAFIANVNWPEIADSINEQAIDRHSDDHWADGIANNQTSFNTAPQNT